MDDEQFYDKYKQYLQQGGTFPSEAQLSHPTASGDDSATEDQ